MLDGIFATLYTTTVTETAFLLNSAVSIALGFGISLAYRKISKDPGTMTSALTVLPFLVQLVILLVNGNLGAGVAVAGAFSLVRFRSVPGTARDIMAIFLAMTTGLCCGMGYVLLAVLAAAVTCLIFFLQKAPNWPPQTVTSGSSSRRILTMQICLPICLVVTPPPPSSFMSKP